MGRGTVWSRPVIFLMELLLANDRARALRCRTCNEDWRALPLTLADLLRKRAVHGSRRQGNSKTVRSRPFAAKTALGRSRYQEAAVYPVPRIRSQYRQVLALADSKENSDLHVGGL